MDTDSVEEEPKTDIEVAKDKSTDDDGFCMPQLPVQLKQPAQETPKPVVKKDEPDLKHNYEEPKWSCLPDGDDVQAYSFDVLKNGTIVETIKLNRNKAFYTFGRYTNCDFMLEHPSLSRFHAIIQYTNGNLDLSFNKKGYYLYDLGSTHGTIMNKSKLEAKKYMFIKPGSVIKFGGSTRLYIFNGPPDDEEKSSDLNINLSHEQMRKLKDKYSKIAIKMKLKRELDEMETMESEQKNNETTQQQSSVDWGLNTFEGGESDENELAKVIGSGSHDLIAAEQTDAYYVNDPKKALKVYFDREGEDMEFDFEELGVGRFKCRIRLPIDNDYGEPIYAEVSHDGKKKDCATQCALEACRILDSVGVLRQSHDADEKLKKKKRDWETNDYYDSDDDTYLDRTGDIEKKRLKRMQDAGKASDAVNKTHTFESLKQDYIRLVNEQNEINDKLEKCRSIINAVQSDDIDAYVQSLKANASTKLDSITRAKMRRRLLDLNNELLSVEKLIKVAKPYNFDLNKWKVEVKERKAEAEVAKPIEAVKIEEPKPIEVVVAVPKVLENKVKETVAKPAAPVKLVEKPVIPNTKQSLPKTNKKPVDSDDDEDDNEDNEQSKKLYKYPTNDEDYSMWLPPENQSGDGKTKLNEKYGY